MYHSKKLWSTRIFTFLSLHGWLNFEIISTNRLCTYSICQSQFLSSLVLSQNFVFLNYDFSKCRFWKLNWYAYENLKIIWPVASGDLSNAWRNCTYYIGELVITYIGELVITSENWRTSGTSIVVQNYFDKYHFVIYIYIAGRWFRYLP